MGFDRRHRTGMVPCCCSNGRPGRPRQYRPHTTGRSWSERKSLPPGRARSSARVLDSGGSGEPELGATRVVQIVDRGAAGEVDLEVVAGEVDRAGAPDEAVEH